MKVQTTRQRNHLHESSVMNSVWASLGSQLKYNQIETGIEIFGNENCQVTLGFEYIFR